MIPETKSLSSFLLEGSRLVDAALDRLVPAEDLEPKKLHRAIRWSVFSGGKRLRPSLVLAAGSCFGAGDQLMLRTAAAIEMIHTYSLIHDDLPAMDDDKLRRGKKTCHIQFNEATAILAGDALQNMAFLTIADDEALTAATRVKLISEIAFASGTPTGMVAGQHLDLEAEGNGHNISLADLEEIHRNKTGAIISVSARAGAIIAGAGEDEISRITGYANNLGLLFQITDDLLDITQTTEILGKTAGKDVMAKKATYPAVHGIAETRRLAGEIYHAACSELDKIDRDTTLLKEIAGFILHRKT